MAFSKPIDRTYEIKINNIGNYDFLADWDTCDYLDPNQLLTNKNDHDLLIMQWNTRGLRSKHGALIEFLNTGRERLIRSHSSARFSFELSRNSN